MKTSPSQSALTTAAFALRGMWAVLRWFAAEVDPWRVIDDWVHGIFRQLEDMLAQFRAGTLVARPSGGAEASPRSDARLMADAEPARDGGVARRRAVRVAGSDCDVADCGGASGLDAGDAQPLQIRFYLYATLPIRAAWRGFGGVDAAFFQMRLGWLPKSTP